MNIKEKALYALKKYYGYDYFRPGQLNIIFNILEGRDTFCIMPTGAGKSICYQIPAIILNGITIVISPLISLMKDQVDNLLENGIESAYINSSISSSEIEEILRGASIGEYKLIYIAPERLESRRFISSLKDLNIVQVTIDEAHCVSEWGHDFRKSYRYIRPFVDSLNRRPVVSAFTGTATEEVKVDTINLLGLYNPYMYIGSIDRSNLYINVIKEEDKLDKIRGIIDNHEGESGIIYCLSRNETGQLYGLLRNLGYNVTIYHGGLSEEDKYKNQENFLYDNSDIIVATSAFGMGIDKSNIRYIIHCTMPKNLESYYQEIGRGGRDGERCDCYLIYNREDIRRVEYLINKSTSFDRREVALKKLQSMIEFCEEDKCYRANLIRYFDNKYNRSYCTSCSNCLNNDSLRDYTRESQMILSTVFRTREKYGISVLLDILRGIKGPKIIANGLQDITTFSIMREYSSSFIRGLIKELINRGDVSLKEGTYSMLKLNNESYKILKGDKKVLAIIDNEDVPIDKELFNQIRSWRKQVSMRENIKPYIIMSDATIIELVNKSPDSIEELLQIRGIGEKKINKYGHEIISIIKQHKK